MRTLYHFKYSPFSRRTRLALAHKGLDCELREPRETPAFLEEARKLVPFRTIPVLVDQGRAMGDSTAIVHWLDRAYASGPRLWPSGEDAAEAFQIAALVDVVLDGVIDAGTRYYALRNDPAWPAVKTEMVGRAQTAANALGDRAASLGRPTVSRDGWSAADMWLLTMVTWFESMPARVATAANIRQITELGFELPRALCTWADAHRERADVKALG
ncbi:MAG: glutathione S-transferase family protein [Polyangiaceae bacterium]|jgi:glutathione S-transferase